MRHFKLLTIAVILICGSLCTAAANDIRSLRCEYTESPLGIDVAAPRLMWKNYSTKPFTQKAYRILVASSPELLSDSAADIWNSGKVKSDDQMATYAGPGLGSHKRYWWAVEVWGTGGRSVSEPAWFETGKMSMTPAEWKASWITDRNDIDFGPSPIFRKEFTAKGDIASARCYMSGVGYYEAFVNGERLGTHVLEPGFTDFGKRVLYLTYDITDILKKGSNSVGVQLGNGWYNEQTPTVWNFHRAPWRDRPRMACEIRITYKDGTEEIVGSDATWKTSTGPIRFDNIHVGTTYDAQYEQPGWQLSGFDDSKWQKAVLTECPAPILEAQKMKGITASETIVPVSVRKMHETSYVFDMGKNFAGVCRLKVKGPRGAQVTLRHGEMLDKEGNVEQRNINMHLRPRGPREVIQTDIYVLKGEGTEEFVPAFTYHGFQYVQVTLSEPMEMGIENLEGVVMHSDVPPVGEFECSDELLNKIQDICKRSYLSNLFGIPTDCPTREKNGWMADGYMVQEAGMLNYDSRNLYAKWAKDMTDGQEANGNVPGIVPTSWKWDSNWAGPLWDAAIFIVPSLLYQYTGDTESMRQMYPTAKRYLEYLATCEKENGVINQGLGDWLYYKAVTPVDFMATCYYYWDNMLMARMAELTGHGDEAGKYLEKAASLKELINKTFFDSNTVSYANRTQLSYAMPLYMGIAPEEYREQLAANLNKAMEDNGYNLDFGFIGSLIVPDVLAEYGYADAAYKMATRTTMPSWGYWINETGATSLYETWDVMRNIGDASRNHPSMGAISAWMYKTLAGINTDPAAPAFKKIIIRPAFADGLDWVEASHESQYGTIKSGWKRDGDRVTLNVTIPTGTTATVVMPGKTYKNVRNGEHIFTADL